MTHLRRLFTSCLRSIHHSWCLVAAMVGFLVGCFWSALSGQYIYLGTSVLIAALSAIILSLLLPTRFSAIFALALGFMLAECRLAPDLIALEQWRALVGQTLTISGTLTEDPSLTSGQIALRLGNLQIHPATDAPDPPPSQPVENSVDNPVENSGEGTSTPTSLPGTLYVTLSGSDGLTTDDLLRSDHLTLTGTLQAGFGTFAATLYRPTVTGWSRASPGDLAAQFKLWFAGLVQTYISSPASDLGLSYLLGYKAGLSDELSDTLQIVGMTHVVVASGSHLGILVGAARKLFGRLSKFASLLFSLLLVGAFLVVVGFTPSMLRAACVTVLTLIFGYLGRRIAPWRLLLLAAFITLVLDPLSCLNLGWQLSFASFAGILVLAPRLQTLFYGGKRPSWLASSLITSFATLLLCAPLLIYTFGNLSLLSIVANLVILPTLPAIMLLVLLTGVTSFLPFLATLLGQLAHLLLSFHLWFMDFLSQFSSLLLTLPTADPRVFLVYLLILPLCLPASIWTKLRQFLKSCYNKPHESPFRIRDA